MTTMIRSHSIAAIMMPRERPAQPKFSHYPHPVGQIDTVRTPPAVFCPEAAFFPATMHRGPQSNLTRAFAS